MDTETYAIPEGVTAREWRRVLRAAESLRIILAPLDRDDPKEMGTARTIIRIMGIGLNIGLSETGHVDFCDVLVDYCVAAGIWPKEMT